MKYDIWDTVYFIMKHDDDYIRKGEIKGFNARTFGNSYIISCGKKNVTVPAYLVYRNKHDLYDYIISQKTVPQRL